MQKTAVLTTIPSDSHSWNLVFMQKFLEEMGLKVINLGTCVPYEEVTSACLTHKPDYLVVSSINGHGYLDGLELGKVVSDNFAHPYMKMIIGGKLHINAEHLISHINDFYKVGFDAVYYEENSLNSLKAMLTGEHIYTAEHVSTSLQNNQVNSIVD
jgi:methylaspartate mutase sigma subunit